MTEVENQNVPKPGCILQQTFNKELIGIGEGPKPNRMSSKQFIVKVQSDEYQAYNPNQKISLYDQSTDLNIQFKNPTLYHLVTECGQLGSNRLTSKKVFCWAVFENSGSRLRIYTDTLAPYQTW